jgi:putative two-component system response regulator
VVDVYDAARSRRCYKGALPHEDVCEIILGEAGRQFDPDVSAAFRGLQESFDEIWRETGR